MNFGHGVAPPQQQQPQSQQQQLQNYQNQMHHGKIVECVKSFYHIQSQQDLQNLLITLKFLQDDCFKAINQACTEKRAKKDGNAPLGIKPHVLERFKKMKDRNHELLIKLLNLREKMVNQMYMYKERSQSTQVELDQLTEKIRHLKLHVNTKYTKLKFLKMTNQSNPPPKKFTNYHSNYNIPLEDLRKGTQIVERQSKRLKQELALLIKFLHGQKI